MEPIRINSREARQKWRELLDIIQSGDGEIVIERYGKPVGKLVSYHEEPVPESATMTLKEAAVAYQTAVFNPMNQNLRTQLKQQLDEIPQHALQAVQQFLQLLATPSLSMQNYVPQPMAADLANQWVGLLDEGYVGDALTDSEALYE